MLGEFCDAIRCVIVGFLVQSYGIRVTLAPTASWYKVLFSLFPMLSRPYWLIFGSDLRRRVLREFVYQNLTHYMRSTEGVVKKNNRHSTSRLVLSPCISFYVVWFIFDVAILIYEKSISYSKEFWYHVVLHYSP